ncbi:MAG: lysophospholipid acyltransferase family protein [Candidatus Puniceispirillales bacterium]
MASMLKSPLGVKLITLISSLVLRLQLASIRWQTRDEGGLAYLRKADSPVIIVNWHCRLLAIPAMLGRRFPTAYIISPSKDGRLISGTVAPLGVETIWGSRSKGAVGGYREMRRRLKQGGHVGITPDGPRGPARKAADGAIALARASRVVIIPVAWSTSRMKRLDTWDRLAIPGWFSRGIQCWGAPFDLPDEAETDRLTLELEDRINAITASADACFGHPPDDAEQRYGIIKEKR